MPLDRAAAIGQRASGWDRPSALANVSWTTTMSDFLLPAIGAATSVIAVVAGSLIARFIARTRHKAERFDFRLSVGLIATLTGLGVGVAILAVFKVWPTTHPGYRFDPTVEMPPEVAAVCNPTGHRIGLMVISTVGGGQVSGEVNECQLLTVRGTDPSWGVGFRPVVIGESGSPRRPTVRLDVFRVTKPGDDQTLAYLRSTDLQEGRTAMFEAPDEGSLLVTVTSSSR